MRRADDIREHLAGSAAKCITGVVPPLDGGWTAQ
jgi:hypothetical protein